MLGRRLLVLMAVLLGLTALATSLAPRPGLAGRDAGSTPAPTAAASPPGASRVITRTVVADPGRTPAIVRVNVGDTLELDVKGDVLDSVEIEGLNEISTLEPGSPAHIELLADAPGRYAIHLLDANRDIGRLQVSH